MKLTRMQDIELCKLVPVVLPDGDRTESLEVVHIYNGMVQYHLGSDEIAAAVYGADIDTIQRIATIHNELEKYLLPRVQNVDDNVSQYVVRISDGTFYIKKVTPKYVDIAWR